MNPIAFFRRRVDREVDFGAVFSHVNEGNQGLECLEPGRVVFSDFRSMHTVCTTMHSMYANKPFLASVERQGS